MAEPVVIVVGAGPAGVRAAEAVVESGLRPVIIDEGRRAGGQIYRRQPDNFTRSHETLYGTEAARARAIHDSFDALADRVDYRPDTLVWHISDGQVWALGPDGQHQATAYDALILCTGATDRLMPVKGWHRAGTYSLGAAQIALKAQACAIGSEVVFLGSGPLLYLVAAQYLKAGAKVAAVLDTAPFNARIPALPKLLSQPGALWNGMVLTLALRRAGIAVHHGVTPIEILGDAQEGVNGIVVRAANGREMHFACDAVGMGHHLRPETQLADLTRCAFAFDSAVRQWLPVRDADGRASVKGVYLGGDGARILGARSAEASGRLAALAALADFGFPVAAGEQAKLRRAVAGYDRFAQGLAQAFPWPAEQAAALPDDAVVCRCESITAGELRAVVNETSAVEVNRAKALSRVGMGRCQGRYCGLAAAEVIAAEGGVPVESVGRLRGAAPVKPIAAGTAGKPVPQEAALP
jgi:NADPH-dependent 2,4-dienoyl-CoA reductase/sulfur reductase-like enzyme